MCGNSFPPFWLYDRTDATITLKRNKKPWITGMCLQCVAQKDSAVRGLLFCTRKRVGKHKNRNRSGKKSCHRVESECTCATLNSPYQTGEAWAMLSRVIFMHIRAKGSSTSSDFLPPYGRLSPAFSRSLFPGKVHTQVCFISIALLALAFPRFWLNRRHHIVRAAVTSRKFPFAVDNKSPVKLYCAPCSVEGH